MHLTGLYVSCPYYFITACATFKVNTVLVLLQEYEILLLFKQLLLIILQFIRDYNILNKLYIF